MSTWGDDPAEVTFVIGEPAPGELCFSLACQRRKVPAVAVVTFPPRLPDRFWRECWRRTHPMCTAELDRTFAVVEAACEWAGVAVKREVTA